MDVILSPKDSNKKNPTIYLVIFSHSYPEMLLDACKSSKHQNEQTFFSEICKVVSGGRS